MTVYIGLVHHERHDERDIYGIVFPDFPLCCSAGATLDEVVREGTEALSFHVEGLIDDGLPIPDPSSIDAILASSDDDVDGAVMVAIPLLPPLGASERINITMPKRLLAQIDSVASNRSGFLAEAARRLLML